MRRADIVIAGLFFLLGLVTIVVIIPTYVTGGTQPGELSPAFMPYVAAALSTGAMALLLVARLARTKPDDDSPSPLQGSWVFIGSAIVVLAATFILMDLYGYLAGASAICAGFMALARTNLKIGIAATIVLPITLWLLFDRLLGFPLP